MPVSTRSGPEPRVRRVRRGTARPHGGEGPAPCGACDLDRDIRSRVRTARSRRSDLRSRFRTEHQPRSDPPARHGVARDRESDWIRDRWSWAPKFHARRRGNRDPAHVRDVPAADSVAARVRRRARIVGLIRCSFCVDGGVLPPNNRRESPASDGSDDVRALRSPCTRAFLLRTLRRGPRPPSAPYALPG